MSKNIWHTADEIPDFDKSYVELSRSLQGDLVYSTWGHPNYITPNTIKWCYMDDLLALETDLERTRKALEIATERLQQIAHESFQGDQQSINMGFHIRAAAALTDIEQITALEQKD